MSPASTSPTHPHQPTEPLPDRLPNAQPEQLADLHEEIIDRFGPLPPEAENLFALLGLKQLLRQLGISKVELAPVGLVFSFSATSSVSPEREFFLSRAAG